MNKIYSIMTVIGYVMAIVLCLYGLTFSDIEVRGIFTIMALTMAMSESILIVRHIYKQC